MTQEQEVVKLVKINTERSNLYGKLSAMYQIQTLIQKEINELERKLDKNAEQK
jgi:hypothetical protein